MGSVLSEQMVIASKRGYTRGGDNQRAIHKLIGRNLHIHGTTWEDPQSGALLYSLTKKESNALNHLHHRYVGFCCFGDQADTVYSSIRILHFAGSHAKHAMTTPCCRRLAESPGRVHPTSTVIWEP